MPYSYSSPLRAGITRLDYSPSDAGYLLLAFTAPTLDEFQRACAAIKSLPGGQRRWLERSRAWRVRASALFGLSSQWPALRDELARLGVGYESSYRQEQYSPPPPVHVSAEAQAFQTLALLPTAPLGLVQAARRWWSKSLHPDIGGDLAQMQRINAAADLAEAAARRRKSAA